MDIKRIKELAGMPKGPKAVKKAVTAVTGEVGGLRLSEEVDFKHLARVHGAEVSIKEIKGNAIGVVTFNEESAEASTEKLSAFKTAWKNRNLEPVAVTEPVVTESPIEEPVIEEPVIEESKTEATYILYVGPKGSGTLHQQFSDSSSAACQQEFKDSWGGEYDKDNKKVRYSHKVVKVPAGEAAPKTLEESVDVDLDEAACPLKGHAYHDKSDAQLEYICKDASEAAKKMKGMNDAAEAKYLDQVNDASTILHYRKKKAVKEEAVTEVNSLTDVKEDSNNFFLKHSETKPMAIMGLQEPNDLNSRMGIDKDRADKLEVPSDVRSAVSSRIAELKKSIEEYDDKGYNDISQKEKAIECLEKIMEHLGLGNHEGLKMAQIFFGTLMSPITECFPAKLITFLGNADARKAGWLDRLKVTEGVGYTERRGILRDKISRDDMNTELGAVGADGSDLSMFPDEHEPSDDSDWESSYGSCFDDGDDGETPEGFYEYTVECPQCHTPNSITPAHLQYAPDPKCVACMKAE